MKGSTGTKVLAFVTAVLLAAVVIVPGVGTLTANAGSPYLAQRDSASVETTTLKKILKIENGSNIPAATFTITVSAIPDDIAKTNSTLQVYKGVTPNLVTLTPTGGTAKDGSADFVYVAQKKTDAKNDSTGDYVTIKDTNPDAEHYTATKEMELNFSKVVFPEPGVYRYILTESGDSAGVAYDTNKTRTLDVYVEDATVKATSGPDQKTLTITKYIMYVGTLDEGPSNAKQESQGTKQTLEDGVTEVTPNGLGVSGATKSVGFVNSYPAVGLTFGNEVNGNQGSKDKYFKYTLTLTGTAGTKLDVNLSKADKKIAKNPNPATTCITGDDGVENPEIITIGSNGTVSVDFYLQDAQYVTVNGLAEGMTYALAVAEEEYTKTKKILQKDSTFDKDNDTFYDELQDEVSGTVTKDPTDQKIHSIYTGYTLSKTGVIPTGVILSVAPWVIAGMVILAGIAFFAIRSGRKYEEE